MGPTETGRIALTGGHLLDVRAGRADRADVVIDGDRIAEVGHRVGRPGDIASEIDCAGRLIVPGFIDCHSHVALTQRLGAAARFAAPASLHPLSAVPVLSTLRRNGVTTVRDAWGADAGLRTALEGRWISGPQLLLSLRQLCTTGGIGDSWSPELGEIDGGDPALPVPVFDGPDAGRAAVRRMVRAGADWIKVTATGSITQGRRATDVQLTETELSAVVDEARRQGDRGVMVHAHSGPAAALAARCGARSVEHGVFLDQAAVDAMAEHGTFLVPTLSVSQGDGADAELAAAHRRSFELAVRSGVPIAMGTDNPVTPHRDVLREIEFMARLGLGPAGALRAATLGAAELLGLAGDRGEITAGKRADLVLLDGTGLQVDDLRRRIAGVWQGGRPVHGHWHTCWHS